MAPPTGPRAGNSDRPTLRTTRGGGIGKRRGGLKMDRDGDVSMGSIPSTANAPTRHSGRGNRASRAGRASRSASRLSQTVRNFVSDATGPSSKPPFEKATVKIHGLKNSKAANNPDGGVRSLLDFLERKASKDKAFTLGRGVVNGDHVFVKVAREHVSDLLHVSGFTFAGATLTIEEVNDVVPTPGSNSQPSASSDARDKLLQVLASRYHTDQKLLDLSALGADPILNAMGSFESKSLAEKSFKALMRLTSLQYQNSMEKETGIQAVSLAKNELHDVSEVFTLAHTLPRLRRLDLTGNKLEDLSKVSKWRHEFRRLEELHIAGNPVANLPTYPQQVIDWFPSLQILDGRRVRTPEEAEEALRAWFPAPLPTLPSNIRDGENNIASTFLHGFFTLYDHDRTSLVSQFYDSESSFSIKAGAKPASTLYVAYSRNLEVIGARSPAAHQRLFTGNQIAELWSKLPPTRHANLDEPDQWKFDCHTFPNLADPSGQGSAMGLLITVHSRFQEFDPSQQLLGTRGFFRSFVLGPSKPGAPHPYRVVSDKLTVRAWVPEATTNTAPQPLAVEAAPAVAITTPPDDFRKSAMVVELAKATGMNLEYSRLCLEGIANWDYGVALQTFEEKKAELPAEAFASSV